jgi:hypothetical protein
MKNRSEIISGFINIKSTYILTLAALRLFDQPEARPFIDKYFSSVEPPYNLIFTKEESKEFAQKEFYKMALRATIKEFFEMIKNYCEKTNQYDKFTNQPWYPYLMLLRNPLSHDYIFKFNKYEKQFLPATWRGRTISSDMDGTPLRVELMDDKAIYELINDVEEFIHIID